LRAGRDRLGEVHGEDQRQTGAEDRKDGCKTHRASIRDMESSRVASRPIPESTPPSPLPPQTPPPYVLSQQIMRLFPLSLLPLFALGRNTTKPPPTRPVVAAGATLEDHCRERKPGERGWLPPPVDAQQPQIKKTNPVVFFLVPRVQEQALTYRWCTSRSLAPISLSSFLQQRPS
jgi:hypothetical protein